MNNNAYVFTSIFLYSCKTIFDSGKGYYIVLLLGKVLDLSYPPGILWRVPSRTKVRAVSEASEYWLNNENLENKSHVNVVQRCPSFFSPE